MDLHAPTVPHSGLEPATPSPLQPCPPATARRATPAAAMPGREAPAGDPGAAEYASWLRRLRPAMP